MPHSETVRVMKIMDALRKEWGIVYPFEKEEGDLIKDMAPRKRQKIQAIKKVKKRQKMQKAQKMRRPDWLGEQGR